MRDKEQGRPQPKMTLSDVQSEMSRFFKLKFESLNPTGKVIPESLNNVIATIQPSYRQFEGVGEYMVYFDVFGKVKDGDNAYKENERFSSLCKVIVKSDGEGSPIIEIKDTVTLNKK